MFVSLPLPHPRPRFHVSSSTARTIAYSSTNTTRKRVGRPRETQHICAPDASCPTSEQASIVHQRHVSNIQPSPLQRTASTYRHFPSEAARLATLLAGLPAHACLLFVSCCHLVTLSTTLLTPRQRCLTATGSASRKTHAECRRRIGGEAASEVLDVFRIAASQGHEGPGWERARWRYRPNSTNCQMASPVRL